MATKRFKNMHWHRCIMYKAGEEGGGGTVAPPTIRENLGNSEKEVGQNGLIIIQLSDRS